MLIRSPRSATGLPPPALAAGLLVLSLLLLDVFAVLGIAAARRDARLTARKELELRAMAQSRAVEASIASLRADLTMLAQTPTVARLLQETPPADPLARRWGRLDAEATLLLFLNAHPALARIALHGADASLQVGRQAGAPILLPPNETAPRAGDPAAPTWSVALADGGRLVAWIDPAGLLPPSDGTLATFELLVGDRPEQESATGSVGVAVAPVTHEGWSPPAPWLLVRREERGELARALDLVTGRFGLTVALNLVVMVSSLVLGWWTVRILRRTAQIEAEREQRERVRSLERQVLHGERLATVGRLAAGFAHEINNPLEGIGNYLAALRDDLDAGRVDEARPLVDRASEGVTRAAAVIRQILTFSEPGSAAKEPIDLRDVLDAAAAFVRSNPRFRHADLRLAMGVDPIVVDGNTVTLGQLALNLLLNALQAEPARGPVEVHARAAGGSAVLEVQDRGPGVPDAVRPHLFEPFTSTRGSTGLGLAVCRGIVLDHDGTIEAVDRQGGGAVFVVRLPLAAGAAASALAVGSAT